RIVGADEQPPFEVEAAAAVHVDAPVDARIEARAIERVRRAGGLADGIEAEFFRVGEIVALDVGVELVPLPVGAHLELGRDDEQPGALAAVYVGRIAVVATGQFERREEREGTGADADRRERILLDQHLASARRRDGGHQWSGQRWRRERWRRDRRTAPVR